jgi:exportin-2 (importin alpha re-exporter)
VQNEIVGAMLTAPEKLQPFLSEALGTISNADFPLDQKWPELMPQLMQHMDSPDPAVVQATLRTTHAISRKYRTASHTDELWNEIAMVLSHTHDRLLATNQKCLAAMAANAGNKAALEAVFSTLDLVARVFYDLNYQDIPASFEDNLDIWMEGFRQLLTLPDPVKALFATKNDDDEKLSTMHQMQRRCNHCSHKTLNPEPLNLNLKLERARGNDCATPHILPPTLPLPPCTYPSSR